MKIVNNKRNTIIAISIVLGLAACGDNRTAEDYIASAQELAQTHDYTKAVIELKNAVKLSPKNAQARMLLGNSYLQLGNYVSAEKELSKAVDLGIELSQIAEPLVKAMSKLNNYEEVYQFVDEASTLSTNQYVVVLVFAGITAINQNDKAKATDYFQQAISLKGDSPYTTLAIAYMSYLKNDSDTSLATARQLISSMPEVTEALLLEGNLLMVANDYANASKSFSAYLNYHPEAGYVKLLEINSLISSGDLVTSEKKVDQVLSAYQTAPLALELKAQIALLKNDYATAKEFAEKAIIAGLNYQHVHLIAGVSAFKLSNFESAYQHLNAFSDSFKADSEMQRLFTFLQLKLGHESDALKSIEEFETLTESDGDLFGDVAMQLARGGDITKAKRLLSKANEIDEDNAVNLLREGMLKLQSADISGVNELEKAIQSDMTVSNAWLTIALAYLQNNDLEKALASAEKWQAISPEDGWALKGVIYLRSGKIEDAISSLKTALAINPKHIGAQMNLIRALMQAGDSDIAANEIKSILANNPNNFKAMLMLINLMQSEARLDEAKAFIQNHMQTHPTLLSAKIAMAVVHQFNKQPLEVINLLMPEKAKLNAVGWRILGNSQLYARQLDDALNTFNEWKTAQPNVVEAWLKMIATLDLLNQSEKAYDTIKEAEVLFKSHPQLLMLKLHYQTQLGLVADANATLSIVKTAGIDTPLLNRLEGELALVNQSFDTAEKLLVDYYNTSPTMDSADLAANALKSQGKIKEAGELLKREFENNKKTYKGLFILAKFFSKTQQYDEAERYYLKVLESKPRNIIALNNLALLKLEQKHLQQAFDFAGQAYDVLPNMPEVLDTLGWIEVQMGKMDMGLKHLEEAHNLAPNSIDIQEHYEQAKALANNN